MKILGGASLYSFYQEEMMALLAWVCSQPINTSGGLNAAQGKCLPPGAQCFCFASGPVFHRWDYSRNRRHHGGGCLLKKKKHLIPLFYFTAESNPRKKSDNQNHGHRQRCHRMLTTSISIFYFIISLWKCVITLEPEHKSVAVGWCLFQQTVIIEELWGQQIHSTLLAFQATWIMIITPSAFNVHHVQPPGPNREAIETI